MITLTASQTAAQKSYNVNPIAKVVLTYGANTYTYDFRAIATNNTRVLGINDAEKEGTHRAEIALDDTRKTLTSLDLEGYKAVLSYGFITSSGDEYTARAPLWVVGQQRDSHQNKVVCSLSCEGTFDRMAKQKATSTMSLESGDASTIKTLINNLMNGTAVPYSRYPTYTVTYDSEDSLIDSFKPADFFRINLNDSRLSKFRELLSYTGCKARIGNDEAIHIFVPTTSGSTYDSDYRLENTYHTFLSKRFRRRVVSPNRVVVQNHPDQGSNSGSDTDASNSLTSMDETETQYLRVTSNAQADSIASAILSHYQLQDEKGAGIIPIMNIGAELYDYVNITDTRAGDSVQGNIGWMTRKVGPDQFGMEFGFGKASLIPLDVMAALTQGTATEASVADMRRAINTLISIVNEMMDMLRETPTKDQLVDVLQSWGEDAEFRKLKVREQLIIPNWS